MKACVVFVEGQADAHYVLRSLGQLAGAKFDVRKPEALPTPFGRSPGQGSQISRGMILEWNLRAVSNRTFQQSAEDNEPVFQVAANVSPNPQEPGRPDIVFVVRMGGDRKADEVKKLLAQLRLTFTSSLNLDVKQIACAFIFDADTLEHYGQALGDCVELREQRFAADYGAALAVAAPTHGRWTGAGAMPFGLFVLHDTTRTGTLEHVVEPALRADAVWQAKLQAAEVLLGAHEQGGDPVYDKSGADRAKARLTIGGQWSEPGSSLAQILRRGDPNKTPTVPDAVFRSAEAVAIVRFLTSVPW